MKPDRLTAKIVTARMTMDFKGALDEGVENAFLMIADFDRREAVLRKLETVHARMAERERVAAAHSLTGVDEP